MNGMAEMHPGSWGRFVRHFLEMVIAMTVGMAALWPVCDVVFGWLGWSGALDRADIAALVLATSMSIGMVVWMRYRRHSWISIWEMCAAMYVPFVALFVPYWLDAFDGDVVIIVGHVLMLPCMVAVMLRRRAEYSQDHRVHRSTDEQGKVLV
jgi:hypothetical protein